MSATTPAPAAASSGSNYEAARFIVARTAWGEARGEGVDGMHGVINVIATRAANPRWWGDDFASVCLRPYQFSCWLPTDPNRAQLLAVTEEDPQFCRALALADFAMLGELNDITGGADSYFAIGSDLPAWAVGRKPTAVIGNQKFYRISLPPLEAA